ncbi:MAG: hypothetical protein IPN20_03345 [Haliscomenobacter sp.]|nr:hypothetical protein [Haliscomenobacter sp.]
MAQMEAIGKGVIALMDQWLKEGTIRDMLFKMNSPEFLDLSYQLYLQVFLPMVEGTNFVLPTWWQTGINATCAYSATCTRSDVARTTGSW